MAWTEMGLHLLEPWTPKKLVALELTFLGLKPLFRGIAQTEDLTTEERMRGELREIEVKLDETTIDADSVSWLPFWCGYCAAFLELFRRSFSFCLLLFQGSLVSSL